MSKELNIVDSSINLFNIDKPSLVFQINKNNNSANIQNFSNTSHNPIYLGQTSLIVTNLTSEYLAFRMKTTKKKYYSVYPSYCNLAPNRKEKIEISYFINEGEKVSNEGHKFKFEAFVISPEEKDKDTRKLFSTYISEKTPVKASSLKIDNVVFIEKENNSNILDKNNIKNNPLSSNTLNLFSERSVPPQDESLLSKDYNFMSSNIDKNKNNEINKEKSNEKNVNFDFPNDFGTPKIKKNSTKKMYENTLPKTEEETNALLNKLKVEYYKLKNELDILKSNYYNLRNHVDLEENQAEDLKEENNKNKYPSINSKEIKLSPAICVVLFILAIILGFYLS
jgi:hypothetical protein